VEKDSSVLGQFYLACTTDEHLNGTLRSKVGLEYLLEAFSSVYVDSEGGSFSDDVGLSINEL